MFLLFLVGQIAHRTAPSTTSSNSEHGQATVVLSGYLATGHPWEALFENWESEFLQMAVFVLLTTFLIQKGSPESRRPGVKRARRHRSAGLRRRSRRAVAGQARRLDLAALRAFARPGVRPAVSDLVGRPRARRVCGVCGRPGGASPAAPGADRLPRHRPRFWFESFQNWQSEFLAIASMVWLAVYLRQRWSPESKPVHAPHSETGR